jgi:DNA (cytosine-5)-methyltransferase 1
LTAYYNEFDPYAAQWLRNLITAGHIPLGDVDERSILEVKPDELKGYTQAHFFAGIGGWSLALRLAGWPDDRPVWTGSCPCQPFSAAGKQKAQSDERHLWPVWFRLIRECRPSIVFGEQVAGAIAKGWFDDAAHDLESQDYAVGSAVLPACGVGAPHKRDRLWFVADSDFSNAQGQQYGGDEPENRQESRIRSAGLRDGEGNHCGWEIEPPLGRVAHGIPARSHKLRAYGNAIVPQVAAEFIKAFM